MHEAAAVAIEQDGVTALEGGQGTDRVQRAGELAQTRHGTFELLRLRAAQATCQQVQALVALREQGRRRAQVQASLQVGQAFVATLEGMPGAAHESCVELVQALLAVGEAGLRALRVEACEQMVEALAAHVELALPKLIESPALVAQRAREVVAIGNQQLGRGRRRRCAQVGGKVGDREVGFVADGADHGDRAGADRARHGFVVERPQVLERTATAREQQHVVVPRARGRGEHGDDRWRRFLALHRHRQDVDLDQRIAPAQHAQHVAHGGAAGRGDDADAAWQARQCALGRRIEQAFGAKARLELLELALQRAGTGFLQRFDDELEVAARLVQAHAGACQHAHAVAGAEAQRAAARAEHRAADLRRGVLEREVQVARRRPRQIGDLALDPQRRQRVLEQVMDEPRQRGRSPDLAGGNRWRGGRRHRDGRAAAACGADNESARSSARPQLYAARY